MSLALLLFNPWLWAALTGMALLGFVALLAGEQAVGVVLAGAPLILVVVAYYVGPFLRILARADRERRHAQAMAELSHDLGLSFSGQGAVLVLYADFPLPNQAVAFRPILS